MRIDNESKVVWLTDTNDLAFVSGESNLDIVSELVKFDGSYDLCSLQNDYFNGKHFTKRWLLMAILNNYEFKLEQPKKHYWRKKKEYLAWFEGSREYLSTGLNGEPILDILLYSHTFTEKEAHDLLKDDFDKFEKVECERQKNEENYRRLREGYQEMEIIYKLEDKNGVDGGALTIHKLDNINYLLAIESENENKMLSVWVTKSKIKDILDKMED